MHPIPLPEEFRGVAFTTTDARRDGIGPSRLRARDLDAPHRGVRRPAGIRAATPDERCLDLFPRLSGTQFFSHTTAAALWRMPLPARRMDGPLHVSAIPPSREPRLPGVIGHRMRVEWDALTLQRGLPVPSAAETWGQLGAVLGLDALIVAADDLLQRRLATADELQRIADRARRRGAVDLRRAMFEARPGSESPKETVTRLILTRAGLPDPQLNWQLHDSCGRPVARLDLAYPRYRVAVEYDGRQHADHEQFEKDADRWAAIEAEGWILVRVLAHHLHHPQRMVVSRARRALTARGWTPG